mmetsp:Transcript_24117/g.39909  ORF Transcript_24117/g.39909 Transcript_24117/m.39909 type:complete len:269 (-) Transcript_24117:1065-1871(-)|eukprot:CAMPEP_0119010760 /NCGR_PEP_ID=MMETSP1176-20130426/5232_1 /TAXON_ID=265551 /ORGANISM="Synedropsis recta cf, Strain CCMP1620" /LENGTH=268 /DNA_ID=CAMNT_0006963485 /DNA_START=119 /DNA_END=925 /DNA_ORIENTATION=-
MAPSATSVGFQALQTGNSVKNFVQGIGSSPQNEDGTIKGEDTDAIHDKVKPSIMDIMGIAGMATSITTLVLTTGHLVDAASYTTVGLAPLAAYQKHQLQKLGGMRGQQNQLRSSVNDLQEQNNILTTSLDKLDVQVTNLEGIEESLQKVATDAQTSVNRLTDIVIRNGEIQAQIKKNLANQVLSSLVSIVVNTDSDRDFTLNDFELNILILRLKGVKGVGFDETNFRKVIPKAPVPLQSIMRLVRNLLDDDVPEQENVFHMNPKEMLQ